MNKNMNINKQKINMTSNLIDDIYYYEWRVDSEYQIIFVGGAFVTIQTYFDYLEHISNEINVSIVAIPLLYQDHSSFKMLDFSFEKQKKIIDKIINKVTIHDQKNIFMGIDIGASVGLYLSSEFSIYILINPFSDWNPAIQNKLFHKISQIPFLYEFIKEYLIKFITFNIFFRIPQKFLTSLHYQHHYNEIVDTSAENINNVLNSKSGGKQMLSNEYNSNNQKCTTCKPVFSNSLPANDWASNAAAAAASSTVKISEMQSQGIVPVSIVNSIPYNIIEFSSLNTFFELSLFQNIEDKLKQYSKRIYLFFNENTITNIKNFYEISKKSGISNFHSVNELQYFIAELFIKKLKNKYKSYKVKNYDKNYQNMNQPQSHLNLNNVYEQSNNNNNSNSIIGNSHRNISSRSQQQNLNTNTNSNINSKNNQNASVSALPPFMTAQPAANPLQPLLDLFQNNPSNIPPVTPFPNYGGGGFNNMFSQQNPAAMNPMHNYLNGIASSNSYANNIAPTKMNFPIAGNGNTISHFSNFGVRNPQHIQNSNFQYNTGMLN